MFLLMCGLLPAHLSRFAGIDELDSERFCVAADIGVTHHPHIVVTALRAPLRVDAHASHLFGIHGRV